MDNFTTKLPITDSFIYKLTNSMSNFNMGFCFFCMLSGHSKLDIEGKAYSLSSNSILLIPPATHYMVHADKSAVFLKLTFDYMFFTKSLRFDFTHLNCNSIEDTDQDYTQLRIQIANIALAYYSNVNDNQFYIFSHIYKLLHYLKVNHVKRSENSDYEGYSQKQINTLKKMTDYIKQNFSRPLNLQDIANEMNITPQYLANYMKKYLHSTFYEYLNEIRLKATAIQLQYTNETPLQIGISNGFPNIQTFQKQFLDYYQMQPDAYREAFLKNASEIDHKSVTIIKDLSLANEYISKNLPTIHDDLSIKEKTINQLLSLDVTKSKDLNPTWKELINLGYAINFDKPDYRQQLSIFQSNLHFKYGRIQGILDLIKTYKIEDRLEYDFSRVFRIIDFLKSIHMLPLFELGNKPIKIYMDLMEPHQTTTSTPYDVHYDKLKLLLPTMLSHCINRYGFDEIASWQFELWMEYNNLMTIIEDPVRYVRRFNFVYNTIKKYVPSAKVGGPGYNTFADISYFSNVLKELIKQGNLPDFISFYTYPYIKPSDDHLTDKKFPVILSHDKDIYKKRIEQVLCLAKNLAPQITRFYVTEYSSYISSHNYINDSSFQAAFIIKETLDNYGSTDAFGYWLVSDTAFEYKDSPGILFGGNGLISRDGIKKPSFYAFSFLETLGCKLISREECHIVTASSQYNYQVIVFNYGYFNENYCRNQDDYELLKYPSSAFEEILPLYITISLNQLPTGSYQVRQHTLSQEYGSVLNEWRKMDALPNLNQSELSYLKHVSVPNMKIYFKDVNQSLELSCLLKTNDVVLFEIDFRL